MCEASVEPEKGPVRLNAVVNLIGVLFNRPGVPVDEVEMKKKKLSFLDRDVPSDHILHHLCMACCSDALGSLGKLFEVNRPISYSLLLEDAVLHELIKVTPERRKTFEGILDPELYQSPDAQEHGSISTVLSLIPTCINCIFFRCTAENPRMRAMLWAHV